MIGVVVTILIMWAAWIAAEKANAGVYAELGHTSFNSSLTTHAIGYRFDSFGLAVEMTGQGETSRGEQRQRYIASAYYVTAPDWRLIGGDFKTILGYAYTQDQNLIGDSNFMLEFALGYRGGVEFYIRHRSSAGAWRPNTGLDSFGIRKLF